MKERCPLKVGATNLIRGDDPKGIRVLQTPVKGVWGKDNIWEEGISTGFSSSESRKKKNGERVGIEQGGSHRKQIRRLLHRGRKRRGAPEKGGIDKNSSQALQKGENV